MKEKTAASPQDVEGRDGKRVLVAGEDVESGEESQMSQVGMDGGGERLDISLDTFNGIVGKSDEVSQFGIN